jgi:hypothetical protein
MTTDSSCQFLCKRVSNLTLSFPNTVNFPHLRVICYLSLYCSCVLYSGNPICVYRGADKFLARPGRKQTRKHVRNARDLNKIEMRAVIRFCFLQGKAPKEIHAVLTEILACFLPGRAKDLSALLYNSFICSYAAPFRISTKDVSRVSSIL